MKTRQINIPWAALRRLVVIGVVIGGSLTYRQWWPPLAAWVQGATQQFRPTAGHDGHDHGAEDAHAAHDHAAHAVDNSIEVSPQALRNLGLTADYLRPVQKSNFRKSIRIPAVVVEQPGRTRVQVSTPMTAIVTEVHVVSGQAIEPGQLMFSLRLTHEDLVSSQTEFLKTLGELDVERMELERLSKITSGAIPGNVVLQRQYEVQKLEARLSADREALRLHGLSDVQVATIETDRKLLRTLEVFAPSGRGRVESEFRITGTLFQPVSYQTGSDGDGPPPSARDGEQPRASVMIIEELRVHQGQAVNAGEALCVLADFSRLFIEGQAFERDAATIVAAREQGWPITAHLESSGRESSITDLTIAYIANQIDVEARTLHFYVNFPNELLSPPSGNSDGRFVTWRYRPGQRLELAVPIEEWIDELVLPVDAVAQEGAESYVFLQNGKKFDRKPVHVKYRDQNTVVIANDGAVFPGDVVAMRGAHQLQMAIKNKSGGGVDPHAGHNH